MLRQAVSFGRSGLTRVVNSVTTTATQLSQRIKEPDQIHFYLSNHRTHRDSATTLDFSVNEVACLGLDFVIPGQENQDGDLMSVRAEVVRGGERRADIYIYQTARMLFGDFSVAESFVQGLLAGGYYGAWTLVVLLILDGLRLFPLRILYRQVGNLLRIKGSSWLAKRQLRLPAAGNLSLSAPFISRPDTTASKEAGESELLEPTAARPSPLQDRVFHYEFTVAPSDCDMFLHMNNCEYNKHLETARARLIEDFPALSLAAEQLAKYLKGKAGKTEFALPSGIIVRFRREIRPLQRILVKTRYLWWEGKSVYSESDFCCAKTGFTHAHAVQVEKFGSRSLFSFEELFGVALAVEAAGAGEGFAAGKGKDACGVPSARPRGEMPEGVRAFRTLNDWSSAVCLERTPPAKK
eukprot:g5485.t1